MKKRNRSHVETGKACGFIPGIPCHEQKCFIRIPSLNFPEMRLLSTFYSILFSGYHRNDDRHKMFDFSFH